MLRDKTPAGGLYALAIGSGIIEIWSGLTSLSRKKKAILEYNSGFDKKRKSKPSAFRKSKWNWLGFKILKNKALEFAQRIRFLFLTPAK